MAQPRVVVVTRKSEYQELIERHATEQQAAFFLRTRGQDIAPPRDWHRLQDSACKRVFDALDSRWRFAPVDRADLDRFLFEPEDVVVAVGQDGLVANVAKYLDGQPVLGINPDPERFEGVLVPHAPAAAPDLLEDVMRERAVIEDRTMVEAHLDETAMLLALNEIFIGHRTHQSARYRLRLGDTEERQSSSGLIVSTGTGASGWTRSIHRQVRSSLVLPRATDPALSFFVREAWPSVNTGTALTEGLLEDDHHLVIVSEMNRDGVVFGDGIEQDRLELNYGRRLVVRVARKRLRLVKD